MAGVTPRSAVLRIALWCCSVVGIAADMPPAVASQAATHTSRPVISGDIPTTGFLVDRATAIRVQGLNDPRLRLTQDQRAQIDKIADAFMQEQEAIIERLRAAPGERANQDAAAAGETAKTRFVAALDALLSEEQGRIRQSIVAERRSRASALPRQ